MILRVCIHLQVKQDADVRVFVCLFFSTFYKDLSLLLGFSQCEISGVLGILGLSF